MVEKLIAAEAVLRLSLTPAMSPPAEARARLLALLGRAPLPGRAPPSPASPAGVAYTGTASPAAGASGTATLLGDP